LNNTFLDFHVWLNLEEVLLEADNIEWLLGEKKNKKTIDGTFFFD